MIEQITTAKLIRRCQVALGYTADVPTGAFGERLCDTVNDALTRIYQKVKLPQLTLFERRTFRPVWNAETTYWPGHECFFQGEYYRALETSKNVRPDAADSPWEVVPLDKLVKFIALDQPWEIHEIEMTGVNLAAFAFEADPRMCAAAPIPGCKWAGDYAGGGTTRVFIPEATTPEVWVAFNPKTPKLSLDPWVSGSAYEYNDRVYHNGDCWRCVVAGTSEEPGAAESTRLPWERVRIPELFVSLIREYVRSAFMEDEQGRSQVYSRFENGLEEMSHLYSGDTADHALAACDLLGED